MYHKRRHASILIPYLLDDIEAKWVLRMDSFQLNEVCLFCFLLELIVEIDETLTFIGNQIKFDVCFHFDHHAKLYRH